MNVSELARKLRIHPQKLLQILPEFGYDIGARAVKVDDRVATQIQRDWRKIKQTMERREQEERDAERLKAKAERQESGASVAIPATISVKEFAGRLNMPVNQLIVELMKNGILATQNENIDYDSATIMAEELGFKAKPEDGQSAAATGQTAFGHIDRLAAALKEGVNQPRPPVLVVMGHVDHGKTKLLDSIRHANVAGGEAGGITQHIGAYQVQWTDPKSKEKSALTFIDTPGHEAFTVMRSRGAKVADIAILVVAADDSVKPQTVEAINIIKAAKLPLVVAINKIDKEGADSKRVRADLAQHDILTDDWGGTVPVVEISAKENLHIDQLLDTLLLVADLHKEKIQADPSRPAAGTVIEAHVDKGQGPVATVLVQTGTLKVNDPLVVNGEIYGKARALKDDRGQNLASAGPSAPVRILGFKIAPHVGDVLDLSAAAGAKQIDVRSKRSVQTGAEQTAIKIGGEDSEDDTKEHVTLKVMIKADTLGSLEAIVGSLEKIKNEEANVKVVGKGLGNISADDVARAKASGAVVYAFNVAVTDIAEEMISESLVECKQFNIIYDLLDDVKERLEKMLNPELVVTELGRLKVLAIFRTDKKAMIVGGRVEEGKMRAGVPVRVKRGQAPLGTGKVVGLQSGKQEVKEVPAGNECGLRFEGKVKLAVGDTLEAYQEETKLRKLVI